jgi:hypothetical protein
MMNAKQFIIYTAPSGAVRVDVLVQGESVWLTQDQLAQLFGRERSVIAKHVKNIFSDGELLESATCAKFAQVRQEGARTVTREVDHYNLDVIISVGYRVNSFQATQFRIWATTTLREFITKGFVLDDERLQKTKGVFGKDYFDELLERIREIRTSERRFYQKITDVYALSVDYTAKSPETALCNSGGNCRRLLHFHGVLRRALHWETPPCGSRHWHSHCWGRRIEAPTATKNQSKIKASGARLRRGVRHCPGLQCRPRRCANGVVHR